jgi:uncharacterized membrane protein YgdD (TMEM256/DUF423 family)
MKSFELKDLFILVAGLMGMAGVALAAGASHGDDPRLLGGASAMCLAHAPVLLVLALNMQALRKSKLAGLLLGFGTILFAADLVTRHYAGNALFPMSAPLGGVTMMAGWLGIAFGGLIRPKQPENRV